jgi:hypothetical protein
MRTMKAVFLMRCIGSGSLALSLFLFSPVLRAEGGAADALPGTSETKAPDKGGVPGMNATAPVKEKTAPRIMIKGEVILKALQKKFDANGDGHLDEGEQKKLDAYLAVQAKKYQQALARYDANKNGVLDRDEKAKMAQDQALADSNERRRVMGEAATQQRIQQLRDRPPIRTLGTTPSRN